MILMTANRTITVTYKIPIFQPQSVSASFYLFHHFFSIIQSSILGSNSELAKAALLLRPVHTYTVARSLRFLVVSIV